jgi:triacylglycerol lipase
MYFPGGFDRARAVQLAELVGDAYSQLSAFQANEAWVPRGKYSVMAELKYRGAHASDRKGVLAQLDIELRHFAKSRLQAQEGLPIGFIAGNKSDVFLVFRGTMTSGELLRNFNVKLVRCPYTSLGKIHDGFLQTYESFRSRILDTLKSVRPEKRLFVTGHSLGAALATLAVPDIIAETAFKSPTVYTFASPRVGDCEFASAYNGLCKGRSFRIVNTCDLVVSIPFPVPFLRFIGGFFTHVDTPVDFTEQKEDVQKNHVIATYLEALETARSRAGLLEHLLGVRKSE